MNLFRLFRMFFVMLVVTAAVSGCKSGTPQIRIDEAEAVLSPMMVGAGSVFMKIVNTGNGSDTLLSARADIPDTIVELHDMKDGRMVKTDAIRIPADGTVQLRPGNLHIMIFKMPATIKSGAKFNLALKFKRSGEKNVALQFTNRATNSSSHTAH